MNKSTLQTAEELAQFAWKVSREGSAGQIRSFLCRPLVVNARKVFSRAGYVFEAHEYSIDGTHIKNVADQMWAWAESVAQNERDTAKGL